MDGSVSNIPTTFSQHLFGIGNLDVLVHLDGPIEQRNRWETPQTLPADIEVSLSIFVNLQHYPFTLPDLSLSFCNISLPCGILQSRSLQFDSTSVSGVVIHLEMDPYCPQL